ncbi:VWA domain-containing protein [uncultured Algibacter sp.]|uniref:VWA domain-containing protein n=1 Tax=uncultured Algibacter sp. TaxID=298659 RepID=UPI00261537BC|nr:VWA domain-containing protein [uncultured Algibacter sp.]
MKKTISYLIVFTSLFFLTNCSEDTPIELSQPEALTVSSEFALKIELSWDEVKSALGYNIYRADYDFVLEDAIFTLIDKVEGLETYTDISVNSSSQYYYRIEAFNGNVVSELSVESIGETRVITAEEAFDILAEYTGGSVYDANNASEVPDAIIEIINDNAVANTDLVFLIDNTLSMSDDIAQVKSSINNIIAELPSGVRLGMATYNDANTTTDWYNSIGLDTDFTNTINFLNSISVFGGGDYPESVYDGLYLTLNQMSWSSTSERIVIVIGDAPPLEGSLTNYSLKDVVDEANRLDIDVNLYPILIDGF